MPISEQTVFHRSVTENDINNDAKKWAYGNQNSVI